MRVDWEYQSRNPWLAAVQDPHTVQLQLPLLLHADLDHFHLAARGVTFGDWQVTPFIDNLFDSKRSTTTHWAQTDGHFTPQQNHYTFPPRTFGITATWHSH